MADLVLWKPAFFGTKPALILKSGFIVAAPMGDRTRLFRPHSPCTIERCSGRWVVPQPLVGDLRV